MTTYTQKVCYFPLYRVAQSLLNLANPEGSSATEVYYQAQVVCDRRPLSLADIQAALDDGVRRFVLARTLTDTYRIDWDMTRYAQNEVIYRDLVAALFAPPAPLATGVSLFVAPAGSDANGGGSQQPLATLEAARDAVRAIKAERGIPPGGITVYLRGGEYYRDQPFVLGPDDSGTEDAPVVWAAYPGETPRLIGGVRARSQRWWRLQWAL